MKKIILSLCLFFPVLAIGQFFQKELSFKNNLGSQLKDSAKYDIRSLFEINHITIKDGLVWDISGRFKPFKKDNGFFTGLELGMNIKSIFNDKFELSPQLSGSLAQHDFAHDGYSISVSLNQSIKLKNGIKMELAGAPVLNLLNQEYFSTRPKVDMGLKAYFSFEYKFLEFFNSYSRRNHFLNFKMGRGVFVTPNKKYYFVSNPYYTVNLFYLGLTSKDYGNFKFSVYATTYSIINVYSIRSLRKFEYEINPDIISFGIPFYFKNITISPELNLIKPDLEKEYGLLISFRLNRKIKVYTGLNTFNRSYLSKTQIVGSFGIGITK